MTNVNTGLFKFKYVQKKHQDSGDYMKMVKLKPVLKNIKWHRKCTRNSFFKMFLYLENSP